jgi:hypothetical protein
LTGNPAASSIARQIAVSRHICEALVTGCAAPDRQDMASTPIRANAIPGRKCCDTPIQRGRAITPRAKNVVEGTDMAWLTEHWSQIASFIAGMGGRIAADDNDPGHSK